MAGGGERVIGEGRFLRLLERRGWELVERPGTTGIVAVVAVTADGRLLLVEQYREPVGARVVELPAGLVGDEAGAGDESVETAARRELLEETGWRAEAFRLLTEGPPSAGLTSEIITFLAAGGLSQVGPGGGDENEEIEVHAVPLAGVDAFLEDRRRRGRLVDPKVYTGLYFLRLS